ncbi:MAG: SulP family inorganic anion transporter [Lachnospiraceae bacterium]|nr:SulP family inorganic anion transporter [Lachnospiraceae bacterium]
MKKYFKEQFPIKNIGKDIFSGIIVALVSIPIALGYAQVAGLPPVYGLYGSLLPIIAYAFISSSRQFVVGVDAMPAAMVGALLASLGIEAGSDKALKLVPVVSILVAGWFLIFFFVKAGRIVNYISNPVMGGFITGVGLTIIMMITPKVLGGSAGTGSLLALVKNIVMQWSVYKPVPILMGIGTIVIIQVCKALIPKVPMSVVVMVIGGLLGFFLPLTDYGVVMLPEAPAGLPKLMFPDFSIILENPQEIIVESLMIALVIMAQTLLATNSYAQKYGFKVNSSREMLAYSAMNVAGAAVGICPINGSVSRSGLADGFGAKSHWMSVSSGLSILVLLLVGTPLLKYLPTPVMTGVVVCALIGILDFKQAKRLWRVDHREFFIFIMAMAGVLLLGTIYGVVIGMVLSFFAVIMKAVVPPRAFLGQIPGHGNDFYNLKRNKNARPIAGTVIYRFGGNLFFANINTFVNDIENATGISEKKEKTNASGIGDKQTTVNDCGTVIKQVIVDARGIGNIDITAADRLVGLHKNLKDKGIKLYITEHGGHINDQLRKYGAGSLIREGAIRRTISLALRDADIERPYPLVGDDGKVIGSGEVSNFVESGERLAEFEWAFGHDAESTMENLAAEVMEQLLEEGRKKRKAANNINNSADNIDSSVDNIDSSVGNINSSEDNIDSSVDDMESMIDDHAIEEAEGHTSFGRVGLFDEDELLDYLEIQILNKDDMSQNDKSFIQRKIEERRAEIEAKLELINPKAENLLHEHRLKLAQHMRETHPEEYKRIIEWEAKHHRM